MSEHLVAYITPLADPLAEVGRHLSTVAATLRESSRSQLALREQMTGGGDAFIGTAAHAYSGSVGTITSEAERRADALDLAAQHCHGCAQDLLSISWETGLGEFDPQMVGTVLGSLSHDALARSGGDAVSEVIADLRATLADMAKRAQQLGHDLSRHDFGAALGDAGGILSDAAHATDDALALVAQLEERLVAWAWRIYSTVQRLLVNAMERLPQLLGNLARYDAKTAQDLLGYGAQVLQSTGAFLENRSHDAVNFTVKQAQNAATFTQQRLHDAGALFQQMASNTEQAAQSAVNQGVAFVQHGAQMTGAFITSEGHAFTTFLAQEKQHPDPGAVFTFMQQQFAATGAYLHNEEQGAASFVSGEVYNVDSYLAKQFQAETQFLDHEFAATGAFALNEAQNLATFTLNEIYDTQQFALYQMSQFFIFVQYEEYRALGFLEQTITLVNAPAHAQPRLTTPQPADPSKPKNAATTLSSAANTFEGNPTMANLAGWINAQEQTNTPIGITQTDDDTILVTLSGTQFEWGQSNNPLTAGDGGLGDTHNPYEQDVEAAIRDWLRRHPNVKRPVHVVAAGHSLGGIVAQDLALNGNTADYTVTDVITFGSPTVGPRRRFVAYQQYVDQYDPVPLFSSYEDDALIRKYGLAGAAQKLYELNANGGPQKGAFTGQTYIGDAGTNPDPSKWFDDHGDYLNSKTLKGIPVPFSTKQMATTQIGGTQSVATDYYSSTAPIIK